MKKIFKSLFIIVMLFTLVACGAPESEKALDSYLRSIKSGKTIEGEEDQLIKILGKLFQKMEYKILKTTEIGNESEIEVHFKVVNIAGYMPDYMRAMMPLAFSGASEETITAASIKFFDDLSKTKDLSYLEQNFTYYLTKENGSWEILNKEEAGKILTGNIGRDK